MVRTPDFREWQGQEVRDDGGERIGTLEEVYFDAESGEAIFLLVKSGLLGRQLTFVPVRDLRPGQSYLQVACSGAAVHQAPTLDSDQDLNAEDEARIYGYYGLDYAPTKSGRRLVRR